MAIWDETTLRSQTASPRLAMPRQAVQALASGVVVLMLASGPYLVLRTVLPQSSAAVFSRIRALEAVPAARAWLPGLSQRLGHAVGSRSGQFVVAFGRFSHRQSAEAHARLVRSKGYIARVHQSGGTYLVLSRPYRSLADATFWTLVFSNIGLEVQTLPGPEAYSAAGVPAL